MNVLNQLGGTTATSPKGSAGRGEDGRRILVPPVLIALGIALVLFGWLFAQEGAAAVRVWDASAAYNHCWLIGPIAAWLAWQRRHRLAGLDPQPMPLALLLMLPASFVWLVAERLGVMEGRQLAAMGMLWVLMLAMLGWPVFRAMAAPLLYLVFLVPFGEFATPLLQDVTAWLIEVGLQVLDISYHREGLIIETTAGMFHVAEACAGLRFLIATLAFGALYALTMFRGPGRRLAVMVLALAVPIFANGLRALGIVVLGQYLGSAQAAAADHVVYGWIFFSIVLLLLILIGLPFRQDDRRASAPPPPSVPHAGGGAAAAAVTAALALAFAAAGPVAAAALHQAAGGPEEAALPTLTAPAGCVAEPVAREIRCPGAVLAVRLLVFPAQVTWAAVAAERWRVTGGGDTDDTAMVEIPGVALWRVRHFDNSPGGVATAAWLDGQPAGDGLRTRLRQAWNALGRGGGGGARPVLAVVTLRPTPSTSGGALEPLRERALMRLVLEAQSDGLAASAAALSATTGH